MKQIKMKLPLLATIILASTFVLGGVAGMFMYATGEEVVLSTFMQMVSHTEYRYGEPGQIVARLVDFQGEPVVVDNCTATIKYPDKTAFVTDDLMSASTIPGDHYYNFTTPNGPEGVYEYQATCYYTVGINLRNQSVTNSFHLSSALTNLLNNQTAQNAQLIAIQGNLTDVQSTLGGIAANLTAVNASLSAQISNLSDQLNTNVSMLYAQAGNNFGNLTAQLNANTTQILDAINNITVEVNFTPVLDAISNLDAAMAANFTYTNSLITGLESNMNSNFTLTFSYLDSINTTSNSIYTLLGQVNTTTLNTYDYVTGTLANNVNTILADLGVINATVNRIETVANQVNSTVTTILENQENEVHMSVFSG